jgi:hypothetical protein
MTKEEALKEVERLRAFIAQEEEKPCELFLQPGTLYEVWDGHKPDAPLIRRLHGFNEKGDFKRLLDEGASGIGWEHYKLHTPQWINIPDDMIDKPNIKGNIVIERLDHMEIGTVDFFVWNYNEKSNYRIKRICVLEEQD